MKVNKTIWIPMAIGLAFGILASVASIANFSIPLGNNTFIGIGEIFAVLSAALGGPIGVISMLLVTYGSVIAINIELYKDAQTFFIALADFTAHLCALLVIAVCYYKLLYPKARKPFAFLLGWWLLVGAYYYLALLPLSVALLNLANTNSGYTYSTFARNFLPEFLGTATVTTLVWFASPVRYRRPQWTELMQTPGGKIQVL